MKKFTAVIRKVRFSPGQYRAIENKAAEKGMPFSSFVRLAALRASGLRVGADELETIDGALLLAER